MLVDSDVTSCKTTGCWKLGRAVLHIVIYADRFFVRFAEVNFLFETAAIDGVFDFISSLCFLLNDVLARLVTWVGVSNLAVDELVCAFLRYGQVF